MPVTKPALRVFQFGRSQHPRLRAMVAHLSDDELRNLSRGGHDYRKVYAAFKAAREHTGQPTVILAHTIKGWTLGKDFEARNATHQMKKLTVAELKEFRDRLYLPIPDSALEAELPPYYHPGEDSDEILYMRERRAALGGVLPRRVVRAKPLPLPADSVYDELRKGSGKQAVATTMAFVRLLKELMKDPAIGERFTPVIPDEARTFGMDSLFPTAKIYSPHGQTYEAVDRNLLLSYKESEKGQILHEGISESGAMGSVIAAATSYATHGTHMIPVYVFYSMFGWQRTRDQTDFINTIPPEREPWFPGGEHVERRIRAYIRWNATVMISQANRPGMGVGGHIATYASAASLYEVGFNHFFRGKDHGESGDQVFFQGHAAPGIYARAFLEGRLTEDQLNGFRQELSHPGGGLPSYLHPRLMPDFWEFPPMSMGLGR